MKRREIICPNPNCGYTGYPMKKEKGSLFMFLFLLLFGVVPGLIYLIFKSGYYYICPKCGIKVGED